MQSSALAQHREPARTVTNSTTTFLESRIASALQTAAEEVVAQISLSEFQGEESSDSIALNEDARLLRRLAQDGHRTYCDEVR